MRAKVLFKTSYVLITSFLICFGTVNNGYTQQTISNPNTILSELINGTLTDGQPKNTVAPAEVSEPATEATSKPAPAKLKEPNLTESNEPDSLVDEESALLPGDEVSPLINKYASMISVHPYEMTNFSLYHLIDDWYGTRYRYGGCDKTGIDCSALSQKIYGSVFGVELQRTCKQQHRHCERIRHFEEASEGDLIFFHIRSFWVTHVGIYLANGYFVHASRSHGVVISNLNEKYWRRHYAGCGRVPREEKMMSESDFMP